MLLWNVHACLLVVYNFIFDFVCGNTVVHFWFDFLIDGKVKMCDFGLLTCKMVILVKSSPYQYTLSNWFSCICIYLICYPFRSSHVLVISCSTSAIILLLCFVTGLLSVFLKCLLGITIFSYFRKYSLQHPYSL